MRTLSLLSVVCALVAGPATAASRIVVLPPDASRYGPTLLKQFNEAVGTLRDGDEILVYTARPVSQLARVARPTDPSLNAARVNAAMVGQFKPVRNFLLTLPAAAGDTPGNLMIPELMDQLTANVISALPEKRAHVLLIGSLLYHRTARTSFLQGYVPSDGVLSAKRDEWVFSTAGAQGRLKGSVIHYCSPEGDVEKANSQHALRLQRFWSLYTTTQGGTVGTFSSDIATCFRRWNAGESSGQPTYQLSQDTKPEMVRILPDAPAVAPTNYDTPGQWFLREDVMISKTPPVSTKGIVWAGISWKVACDLDIYSRPDPESSWLYFGSGRTADGHFSKDLTSATGDQFEFVEYTREVNLTTLEIAVNVWACSGSVSPEGTVRLWISGKVFQAPFKLAARNGNKGAMPISPPYWSRIDVLKLVGLVRE